jgi:hypothetical protein
MHTPVRRRDNPGSLRAKCRARFGGEAFADQVPEEPEWASAAVARSSEKRRLRRRPVSLLVQPQVFAETAVVTQWVNCAAVENPARSRTYRRCWESTAVSSVIDPRGAGGDGAGHPRSGNHAHAPRGAKGRSPAGTSPAAETRRAFEALRPVRGSRRERKTGHALNAYPTGTRR